LIVTMHNLAKGNQQETNRRIDEMRQDTNRRIDELKKDLRELLDARFKVIDSQFKIVDSQFEVAGVRFQKLEGEVAEVRQGVQDIKKVIFKPAA